jgi:glutathione S-transferase
MTVELYGFQFSVYSWIARLALEEKGVAYRWIEVDPFAREVPEGYLALHPFKRVPALVHDDFQVYETGAMTRYVDEAFAGPGLQPSDPRRRARCSQFLSIVDSYVYWPTVRQVFSHRVFRPRLGRPADLAEIKKGLEAAPRVLTALERLAADAEYLCGDEISLADIHLAPMIGYFAMAEEGEVLLKAQRKLGNWWSKMSARNAYRATKPPLPMQPESPISP